MLHEHQEMGPPENPEAMTDKRGRWGRWTRPPWAWGGCGGPGRAPPRGGSKCVPPPPLPGGGSPVIPTGRRAGPSAVPGRAGTRPEPASGRGGPGGSGGGDRGAASRCGGRGRAVSVRAGSRPPPPAPSLRAAGTSHPGGVLAAGTPQDPPPAPSRAVLAAPPRPCPPGPVLSRRARPAQVPAFIARAQQVAPIAVSASRSRGSRTMASSDVKVIPRRATRRAPAERMSKFLRHFTVVGDDYHTWNINYKKWENEEDEEEQQPPAPAAGEEGGGDAEAGPESAPRPARDFRSTLRKLFSSHRFQVVIICLVILDALLVLAELILDLGIIQPDKNNYAAQVFHYTSIAILIFFMMEIFFKIYVFRLEFFHHKFEILDAIVVVVSFILDIVLLFREHEFEALGLLILLRLWRVARIINGIIISVKTRSERQLLRLKQMNMQLVAKIQHLEFSCSEKEQEIERLNKLLRQHGLLSEVN